MLVRAARYINIEENFDTQWKAMKASTSLSLSPFKRRWSRKFENCTPLNATGEVVLRKACNLNLVWLPSLTSNNPSSDPAKHYIHHQNQGDNVEKCFKLKDFLEELVGLGALIHFIHQVHHNHNRKSFRGRGRGQGGGPDGRGWGTYRVEVPEQSRVRTT